MLTKLLAEKHSPKLAATDGGQWTICIFLFHFSFPVLFHSVMLVLLGMFVTMFTSCNAFCVYTFDHHYPVSVGSCVLYRADDSTSVG